MSSFVCRVDETEQGGPEPDLSPEAVIASVARTYAAGVDSLAREVLFARESLAIGLCEYSHKQEWLHRLSFIAYAVEHPSRRKRTPMDVNQMVENWLPLIVKLATAHDVDERDSASSQLDEFLTPIIAAPVVQIREFYRELVQRMKADPGVPWAVWRLFEFWGTNVLDKIDKEEVIGLKTELAKRIAENSFAQIPREDWIQSMVGALQWRDPEKLKQLDAAVSAGAKPRVRGKESCLFLVVQVGEAETQVML